MPLLRQSCRNYLGGTTSEPSQFFSHDVVERRQFDWPIRRGSGGGEPHDRNKPNHAHFTKDRRKIINLNSEVLTGVCPGSGHTMAFLGMSMQPRHQGSWKSIDVVRDTFRCSR
jgi:hypothetical protein